MKIDIYARYDFNQANGGVKETVFYQWFLNGSLVSTSFDNKFIPIYLVHIPYI